MPMNPRLLVPRATFDPDAAAYLRAVEAADGQALETPVKRAVDDFFRGCKADGIWDAIKASCILCGARTLAGALVPLVGTAPTNNNFVDADYNRETGLIGNGSTKYLDSNRANDDDPEDDNHIAVYKNSTGDTSSAWLAGSRDRLTAPVSHILVGSSGFFNRSNAAIFSINTSATTGLRATSRSSSLSASAYYNSTLTVASVSSVPVSTSENQFIFAFGTPAGTAVGHSDARLAFYSIGESLDLALLDARVSALVTAIGDAI
jgi:hypothetical protein